MTLWTQIVIFIHLVAFGGFDFGLHFFLPFDRECVLVNDNTNATYSAPVCSRVIAFCFWLYYFRIFFVLV